jgi:hypothetical protein
VIVDIAGAAEHLPGAAAAVKLDPVGAAGEPRPELAVTDPPRPGLEGEGMEHRCLS